MFPPRDVRYLRAILYNGGKCMKFWGSATFCLVTFCLINFLPCSSLPSHTLPGVTFRLGNARANFLPFPFFQTDFVQIKHLFFQKADPVKYK